MDQKTKAAILSLPHIHHPQLNPLVMQLANHEGIDFKSAVTILEAARKDLKISTMDIQFAAPGASPVVRFASVKMGAPVSDYQDMVASHFRRIVGAQHAVD